MDNAAPKKSSGRLEESRDSGIQRSAPRAPTPATGTLIRKTEPHQKWESNHPPAIGPMAIPRPVVPDQIPMARACSEGSRNTSVMIDSVAGMMQAAPTPMIARAEINVVTESEKAEYAEPNAKMISPARRSRLRPKRSPTLPAMRSKPAKTQA